MPDLTVLQTSILNMSETDTQPEFKLTRMCEKLEKEKEHTSQAPSSA